MSDDLYLAICFAFFFLQIDQKNVLSGWGEQWIHALESFL